MKSKRRFKLILIALIIVVIIFVLYRTFKPAAPSPIPSTSPAPSPSELSKPPSWQGIIPSETTLKELTATLGEPVLQETIGNQTISSFNSDYPGFYHQITTENDKVTLIREQYKNSIQNPTHIQTLLPNPISQPTLKYLTQYGDSTPVYIYAQNGQAFIAHESDQTVYEVWYFNPTSNENFISQHADLLKDKEAVQSLF